MREPGQVIAVRFGPHHHTVAVILKGGRVNLRETGALTLIRSPRRNGYPFGWSQRSDSR